MLEKKRSRVMTHGGTCTLLGYSPYYDEDGMYHIHDPNWRSNRYTCSNGHEWHISRRYKCLNCDFGKYDIVINWTDEQIGKV